MKNVIYLFLFIKSNLFAQNEYVTVYTEINEPNVTIEYYKVNFVYEDSVEYTELRLDNKLNWTKRENKYLLSIPLNSNYLVQIYDQKSQKYKYIQVSTGKEKIEVNTAKVNFNDRIRLCVYYDDKEKKYKQFTTTEPYEEY